MALVSERDFWVLIRFDQGKSLSGRVPNSAKRLYVRREQRSVLMSKATFAFIPTFILICGLRGNSAFAQSPGHPESSMRSDSGSVPSADANSTETDAQILKELEQMRARIQILESKLKHRTASHPDSSDQAVQSAAVHSPVVASQTVHDQSTEEKEKAEPFAFAVFTWLNGNASDEGSRIRH
jgi:hypothetical protein